MVWAVATIAKILHDRRSQDDATENTCSMLLLFQMEEMAAESKRRNVKKKMRFF